MPDQLRALRERTTDPLILALIDEVKAWRTLATPIKNSIETINDGVKELEGRSDCVDAARARVDELLKGEKDG